MNFKPLIKIFEGRTRRIISLGDYRPAAVLVPLVLREKFHLLLTTRASHLKHHPGEVSFPGGKVEWHDESRLDTALREMEEEVGIPPGSVEVIGPLDDATSITGFHIMPYVGNAPFMKHYPFDHREIESVHLVPLKDLLAPPEKEIYKSGKIVRPNFVYKHNGIRIFGVTAFMIRNFVKILNKSGFIAENKKLVF
jgi:8-oxo-dGTP pyrophosphatase MutT (NUDIX family)